MRKEALLLRIEHRIVAGEIEAGFFAVHLYLGRGEGRLQPVGRAFVVGAKDHRPAVFGVDPQLVVVVAYPREFLPHGGLEHLIDAAFLHGFYFHVLPQLGVIDVDGQRRILEQDLAVQQHVVLNAVAGPDSGLDPFIGRVEAIARLGSGGAGKP